MDSPRKEIAVQLSSAAKRNLALFTLCVGPLALTGCQTSMNGAAPTATFAQNRGWVVERVAPANDTPYCVAYRPSGLQDLTFVATPRNTGVALSRVGVAMQSGAVYDFNVSFDGGQTRGLKSKPGGGMLVAPLGERDVGRLLSRFASASSAMVSVPALGVRKRYDLDGSTWAISKLSECAHGAPARFPKAATPTKPTAPSKSTTPTDLDAAPADAPTPSQAPAPASAAPAAPAPTTGGVDLDMDIKQGVDLD